MLDLEVGCALAGLALWLVLDGDTAAGERVQQGLQRRPAGKFGMLPGRGFAELEQIGVKFCGHARISPAALPAVNSEISNCRSRR